MQFVDTSIIMGGKAPDIGNALAGGIQSGVDLRDARYTGQYRNALAAHGAGAVAGDQTARNALAGFDPTMVQGMFETDLGMDQTRLSMQETEQRMQLARETGAREAQRYADEMTAAQAAQAAEEYRRQLQPLMMATTPEAWAQASQAMGLDPAQAPWEMRDVILAQEFGAAEVLDLRAAQRDLEPQAPAVPAAYQALEMRAQAAGLVPGTPEYQAFMISGGEAPQNMIIRDTNGNVIFQQGSGGAGGGAAFTEGQSKDIGFAARARDALGVLEPVADQLTSRVQQGLGVIPFDLGRGFQDENYQVAENAGTNFLLAILRKDTGAAVTASEEEMYGRIFLPRPGDSAELLAQKARAREMAIAGLEAGMSAQQLAAQAQAMSMGGDAANQPATSGAQIGTAGNRFSGLPRDELLGFDLDAMSEAELQQWLEATEGM